MPKIKTIQTDSRSLTTSHGHRIQPIVEGVLPLTLSSAPVPFFPPNTGLAVAKVRSDDSFVDLIERFGLIP